MRLGRAAILVLFIALAGCRNGTPKPIEKKDPTSPVTRPKGATPAWLDESMAKLPGAGTTVPKGGAWGTPGADQGRGMLAGRVLDPFGNGAKNVYIRIEAADATPKEREGQTVGILSDEAGFFMAKDLPPGRTYVLTAEAKSGGKPLYGVVQTKPPQTNLTIALRDDLGLPGGDGLPPAATAGLPPPGEHIPSPALPMPGASSGVGGWNPGTGAAPKPIPATFEGPIPGAAPPSGAIPPPSSIIPGIEPGPGVRPESTATGRTQPSWPPAASIPGPGVPALPAPPPGVPTLPGKMSGLPRNRGADVALVDSLERPWSLADRSGSLVLLEFMTSTCVPCRESIPLMTAIQSKYANSGLQLVGVMCDDVPQKQRATLAAKYQRNNGLNYAVFVEAGAEPGTVRDRFNVDSYPTAVLLNGDGQVLWQGHPAKTTELEAALRRHLGR